MNGAIHIVYMRDEAALGDYYYYIIAYILARVVVDVICSELGAEREYILSM